MPRSHPHRHPALIALASALVFIIGCDSRPDSQAVPQPAPVAPAQEAAAQRSPEADSGEQGEKGQKDAPGSVAAWVGKEAIPTAAIDGRLEILRELYREQHRPFGPRLAAQKRALMLDRLIDEALLRQRLDAKGIRIDEASVDAELDRRIRRRFRDPEHLDTHLARLGESMASYRSKLREELAIARLLGITEAREELEEGEVCALYERLTRRPALKERARVRSLFLELPEEMDDEERAAKSRQLGVQLSDVRGARDFDRLRRAHRGRAAAGSGDGPRWVERGAVAPEAEEAIFSARPGSATPVITTPEGLAVYWVEEIERKPTPHFLKRRALIRERALQQTLGERRAELLEKLREEAQIRIPKRANLRHDGSAPLADAGR